MSLYWSATVLMKSFAASCCHFKTVSICKIYLSNLDTCLLYPKSALLQAAELADLEDEANMPLEQLLARYRYANISQAGPSHTSSSPSPTAPQPPALDEPLPTQAADDSHLLTMGSTQHIGQVQAGSIDKAKGIAPLHGRPPSATPGVSEGPQSTIPGDSGGPLSAAPGVPEGPPSTSTETGTFGGRSHMKPKEQAEQATAAGMDAFEHSQALAERRASGSQAGPSALSPPAPGNSHIPLA